MDSFTREGLAHNTFNITNFARPTTSQASGLTPAPQHSSNTGEAAPSGEATQAHLLPPDTANSSSHFSRPPPSPALGRTPVAQRASNAAEAINSGEATQAHLPSITITPSSPPSAMQANFPDLSWNPFLAQALASREASTLGGPSNPHLPTPPESPLRSGQHLQGLDIPAGFIYQDSDFMGVNISGCILVRCKISPSDGRESRVQDCTLIDCDVLSAHLENCSISSADERSELISCNLTGGKIWHAVSANCNFDGVKVEKVNCSGFSYFENCKIEGSEFRFGPRFGRGCEIFNSWVLYQDDLGRSQQEWVVRRWIE